ncbi:hypothetical protein [Micromonospora sp. NPDC007230]|uniref:hypothetical protein n=1 Tax=Micromonospora sp. NPDC007230 TaxID=3364237 RepID=UPI0036837B10
MERAEKVVLEYRAATSDPRGAPTHLRIKANDMIRAALTLAAEPIRWVDRPVTAAHRITTGGIRTHDEPRGTSPPALMLARPHWRGRP